MADLKKEQFQFQIEIDGEKFEATDVISAGEAPAEDIPTFTPVKGQFKGNLEEWFEVVRQSVKPPAPSWHTAQGILDAADTSEASPMAMAQALQICHELVKSKGIMSVEQGGKIYDLLGVYLTKVSGGYMKPKGGQVETTDFKVSYFDVEEGNEPADQ